jgi:hypothetical protein
MSRQPLKRLAKSAKHPAYAKAKPKKCPESGIPPNQFNAK